jgi:hypothetical protein
MRRFTSIGRPAAAYVAAAALTCLASGCAQHIRASETVGPVPEPPPSTGRLVVFTEFQGHEDPNGDTPRVRLPYELFDVNGRFVRKVESNNYDVPTSVALEPGEYSVHARGRDYADADVRVRVAPGRTTEVFLDGTKPSPGIPDDARVRASNGAVIGWRAVH